ncbi:MAG: hypothetical protein IT237_07295 [Bacteroidia bacterium]|nr:hypothetical protein [Bacteroidia bacterium]
MIKNICFLLGVICFTSCTQVNTTTQSSMTQGHDTIGKVAISITKNDSVPKIESVLLFKATGTEPGWFAEFYSDKLRLVLDYGSDSLLLNHSFTNIENENGFRYEEPNVLDIQIHNTACVDAGSGEKREREIFVKYKDKTYKGCGYYIK